MKELFNPNSVAVIGVSKHPFNLGKEIARNLLEFSYEGEIHLVGKEGGVIFGRKIHDSILDAPGSIDLAVILTPGKTVPGLIEQCAEKGVKRVIIESGGFGEYDSQGKELADKILSIAKDSGMRIFGPNCIGVMNSANGLATPFTTMKNVFPPGGVGIIAQSGGVALSFLNMFEGEHIGFSKFAAIGNKLDMDENDVIEYYLEATDTTVICAYLESIRDGRRLMDLAKKSHKPIVVHKANISPKSAKAAHSHTEALTNDDAVVDAAFKQSGIVRFTHMGDYLNFVKILQLPRMRGRNLAIVSRSGGHAVMAADAAATYGFNLPAFSEDFLNSVRKQLRADVIKLANPLDLGDLFDFEVYARILEHTIQLEEVDGILFTHTYFASIEGASSRKLLRKASAISHEFAKPVVICVGTENYELSRLHKELDFPIFLDPEAAVKSMDEAIGYFDRKDIMSRDGASAEPASPVDKDSIKAVIDKVRPNTQEMLLHDALDLVSNLGIKTPDHRFIGENDTPSASLGNLEGHCALKIVAEGVSHKSDFGGVVLGLSDIGALENAFDHMMEKFRNLPAAKVIGALAQTMIPARPGTFELIVGAKRDPHFGPVVMVGQGGIFVEVMSKVSVRLAPMTIGDVDRMIEELPGAKVFQGVRGLPATNLAPLKEAIVRIAWLMTNFPEIDQLDINPFLVSDSEAYALDARIFLG